MTLRLSKNGYAPGEPQVRLKPGETTNLDEITAGFTEYGVGSLGFSGGLIAAYFQDVLTVTLRPESGDGVVAPFDEEGVSFEELAVGRYRLEVTGGPFVFVGTAVDVGPGEDVVIDDIALSVVDAQRRMFETAVEGLCVFKG